MADELKHEIVTRFELATFLARFDLTRNTIVAMPPNRISESGYVLEYLVVWKHAPA